MGFQLLRRVPTSEHFLKKIVARRMIEPEALGSARYALPTDLSRLKRVIVLSEHDDSVTRTSDLPITSQAR